MGILFMTYWREVFIVSLIGFIYLADTIYVDRIKLERDLAQARYATVNVVLENQTQKILDNSEATKIIVKQEMQSLEERLERLNVEQRKQIEDLLKVEIPHESMEELMEFLIDLASDRLRWSDD